MCFLKKYFPKHLTSIYIHYTFTSYSSHTSLQHKRLLFSFAKRKTFDFRKTKNIPNVFVFTRTLFVPSPYSMIDVCLQKVYEVHCAFRLLPISLFNSWFLKNKKMELSKNDIFRAWLYFVITFFRSCFSESSMCVRVQCAL